MAMMRAATRWVALVAAERTLADARRAREEGKGRRPSQAKVNQLAKRAGLEDESYQKALAALREMAALHRRSPDELVLRQNLIRLSGRTSAIRAKDSRAARVGEKGLSTSGGGESSAKGVEGSKG
jgi:hypothetical protein